MQGKYIKHHIKKKIEDWAASVTDEAVKYTILHRSFVSGGAITSLLLGEDPRDYDVYFTDIDSLKLIADYYTRQYCEDVRHTTTPQVQRCVWDEEKSAWRVLKDDETQSDMRLRIFIKSDGYASLDEDDEFSQGSEHGYTEALESAGIKPIKAEAKKKDAKQPYRVKYMTNNAITLSNGIQCVLRFYGQPEAVHENFDFIHCMCHYSPDTDSLVLPARSLEAIINKELFYVGSKYPLCSIIRARKFIQRGWSVNAGQYVKMVLQLNDMDLKNLHVFEEQLVGVDSAYFGGLIAMIEKEKEHNPNVLSDTGYLIELINHVF